MFRRLRNLWKWSALDPTPIQKPAVFLKGKLTDKEFQSIVKEGKKLATIVEDKQELFPQEDGTTTN